MFITNQFQNDPRKMQVRVPVTTTDHRGRRRQTWARPEARPMTWARAALLSLDPGEAETPALRRAA